MSMAHPYFLSEEQESIRQLIQEFAEREILPVSKKLETGDLETIKALWAKIADAGLTGLPYPEAYGGAAVDSLAYALALEELAKASPGLATSFSVHTTLCGVPIMNFGTEAQKAQYLPDLIAGTKIGAFALTEPNAGSDAGAGITTAKRDGEYYILNGSKIFITNALTAGVFVATARTDQAVSGAKGLSAFLIDSNAPGMTVTKGDDKMGLLGSDWGELHFDNCKIHESARLSDEGMGFKLFMKSLDVGRISIGAISLGLAEACLEASIAYANQRKQFGKTLGEFQAIQFKLAGMATQIEASRGLVYHAARLKEAGLPFSKEASMAKLYASEMVNRVAAEAVQIFGGYGYTKDFPVERYFRDARVMSLFEGTSEVQHIVIARHLLS
ncbi:MAG: acyl-CoA dehydrogenase family protein [Vampirovibrionales bacterium]|nr:acyl-CoA dehydrogenase family protein [Vampirovibrionales bacterium]